MEDEFEIGDEIVDTPEATDLDDFFEGDEPIEEVNQEVEENENESVEVNDKYDAFTILQEFGSEDGMIEYGDKKVHISELTPEEQLDVTGQLFMEMKEMINNQPDFDNEELNLISEVKSNGMSLAQYMEAYAEQRVQEVIKQNELNYAQSVVSDTQENIDDYSDDDIMIYHLKSLDPDITNEELKEELETKKASRTYEKELLKIREDIKREQTTLVETQKQVLQREADEQIENLWNEGVNILQNTKTIAGFDITDMPEQTMKELLEDTLIPIDDDNNSKLLATLYTNSEARLKAMFFLKHEQAIVDNIAEQDRVIADFPRLIKEAEAKAYQKGQSDLIKNKYPQSNKPNSKPTQSKPLQKVKTIDDFFDE